MIRILFISIIVLFESYAFAYDKALPDCARTTVQTAINAAAENDTLICPAGSWNWGTTPVTINNKALTLRGAGDNNTVINVNWADAAPLSISTTAGKFVRVTGFKFVMGTDTGTGLGNMIGVGGSATSFRLDHLVFDPIKRRGIVVTQVKGLIDHCIFIGPSGSPQGVSFFGNRGTGGGDTLIGSIEWQYPAQLGTANAVYLEDSVFIWNTTADSFYDAYSGARFVVRYNTITGVAGGHHGNDSGSYRSPHSYEIYNNTFYNFGSNLPWIFNNRGGTGVYYNNVATGNYNGALALKNYRAGDGIYATPPGACNGTNPRDGNLEKGWPCQDQIGRTTDNDRNGVQDSLPLHQWNNTLNGAAWKVSGGSTGTIIENRDYYNRAPQSGDAMYGYKAYTYPHPLQSGIDYSPKVPLYPIPEIK